MKNGLFSHNGSQIHSIMQLIVNSTPRKLPIKNCRGLNHPFYCNSSTAAISYN